MSNRWRGIVAALLNPELRAALAEVSTTPLTDARRARSFERLTELGLVRPDGEGWVFTDAVLRSILDENPPVIATGPERFLDAEGRIDRYPLRDADRLELLQWVAQRALPPGVVWTESGVNDLLLPFAPGEDVAVLRRYLVDADLLERTRSGSEYARVDPSAL